MSCSRWIDLWLRLEGLLNRCSLPSTTESSTSSVHPLELSPSDVSRVESVCTSPTLSPSKSVGNGPVHLSGQFVHQHLDDATSQIRVIRIQPGQPDDPLDCTLTHQDLEQDKHICLSYCWGDEPPTEIIYINGRPFSIRPNLYQFLLTARSRSIFEPLWIDAICVVQSHSAEKGAQVQMMGEIYRLSKMAIVWLGLQLQELQPQQDFVRALDKQYKDELALSSPVLNHCDKVVAYIAMLAEADKGECDLSVAYSLEFAETVRSMESVYTQLGATLVNMMLSRYWSRAWIVQEWSLSKPYIMLRGGFLSASTFHRLSTPLCFLHKSILPPRRRSSPAVRALGISEEMWRMIDSPSYHSEIATLMPEFVPDSWWEIGFLMSQRECFDIRDRIYSCVSLLPSARRVPVDYTISKELLCLRVIQRDIWKNDIQRRCTVVENLLSAMQFDIRSELLEPRTTFWIPNRNPLRVTFTPVTHQKIEGTLALQVLSPTSRRFAVFFVAFLKSQGARSYHSFHSIGDSYLYLSGQWVKIPGRNNHPCPTILAGSG